MFQLSRALPRRAALARSLASPVRAAVCVAEPTRCPALPLSMAAEKGLRDYLKLRMEVELNRFYDDGWTCQGVLRILPRLARLYALRLVHVSAEEGGCLPAELVDQWPKESNRNGHLKTLQLLRDLHLLKEKELTPGKKSIWLHRAFARQLRDCLCVGGVLGKDGGGVSNSAALIAATSSSPPISLEELERHACDTWERVLQVILTPRDDVKLSMRSDGASFHALLCEAKLIEEVKLAVNGDDDEEASAAAGGGGDGRNPKLPRLSLKIKRMRMSRMAAKFLLMPTGLQVWQLVRAYMELADKAVRGTGHATLCFLMRLGLLELGRPYLFDDPSLDEMQRATLADMALLGLVHRPAAAPHVYYATHLSQHLLTGVSQSARPKADATGGFSAAGGTKSEAVAAATEVAKKMGGAPAGAPVAGSSVGAGLSAASGSSTGFIVLETNFRLYAYTDSPVWAQVLQIFAQLQYLLPNMIVGDLTRDSLLAAAQRGVTAVDIAEFLERNAHPRMLARVSASAIAAVAGGASLSEPSMPENVLNLMEIWSKEKHRLSELHGPAPQKEPYPPAPPLKKNLHLVCSRRLRQGVPVRQVHKPRRLPRRAPVR